MVAVALAYRMRMPLPCRRSANIMLGGRSWVQACRPARCPARVAGRPTRRQTEASSWTNLGQHFAGIRPRLVSREPGKPNLDSVCQVSRL